MVDPAALLVEAPKLTLKEPDDPSIIVPLFQANVLSREYLADVRLPAMKAKRARTADQAHLEVLRVVGSGQIRRQSTEEGM